ncbi:hypothetical protein PP178_03890 [Zeaxanthinibacter sp. PT1]|uniref:hypothetical protein n=1 Tax=Zeaxanthinibacter TaxID=561554 RepID=UPI00234AF47E|nr:hypothetical protein [Zeaxanthinibacter sp. PT1]MDC6350681.1 hypothetical protein [Zeaxanthinibacter sp. PT1]
MLTNTQEFRREAQKFLKHGYYCGDPAGTANHYEYWSEQLRRCKEGFTVGDTYITGHHYFYLNFCQIRLTDGIKKGEATRKVTTFPGFWDGDYHFFIGMEEAAKQGKHMIVSKARRKGFSYKNAAIAANIYNTQKHSYTLLCAHDKKYLYPKGIMTMATNNLNFLNEHTAWSKRRQRVDQMKHVKASYLENVGGQIIEKGYKSEIEAITFKDNPDAARGKDASFIIFEEGGAFDNLKPSYLATLPCVQDGGVTTGQIIVFGTGGDMEGGTIDFESMFYNPEAYDMYAFDNVWDEGGAGDTCGYFFPSFMNKIGFMDNDGNSLIEKAKQEEQAKRDDLKANAKDAGVYDKYITEYPWCPKEAFLQTNSNMFPTVALADHRGELVRSGLNKRLSVHGRMVHGKEGPTFRMSENARPLDKFPTQKGDDIRGCVTIWQAPYVGSSGHTPDDMYVVVHDPYAHEGGKSLGAAYIMKRPNRFSKPDDMIVAGYVGRPDTQDEYNEQLFMLAEYYNARIGFENDRGEVIPYAKRHRKLHMLLHEAEIFSKKENINIKALGRGYGCSMGSRQRKDQAEIYLRDWLKVPRGITESGEKRLNLHFINDIALLDELIKYDRDKGNFDRVSALLVGMMYLKDLHDREVEESQVTTESDNFWNTEFFG